MLTHISLGLFVSWCICPNMSYLIPGLCLKPRGLSESHKSGMISAFRHALAQAAQADKNYVEEIVNGQVKVSGNPFNTTIFKTLDKNLSRTWRKFGPATVRARTISVYTLERMFDATFDVCRFFNGITPNDPSVISRLLAPKQPPPPPTTNKTPSTPKPASTTEEDRSHPHTSMSRAP